MAVETDRSARPVENNIGLVQQLLNDVEAECYMDCAVSITSLNERGEEHIVVGSVNRVDLRRGREIIYINEAHAIEGVHLSKILSYKWK